MKRIVVNGLSVALLLGVVGCGPAGMDAGVPEGDLKSAGKVDPSLVDPAGRFGAKAAKEADTKNAAGKNAPAPEPAAP